MRADAVLFGILAERYRQNANRMFSWKVKRPSGCLTFFFVLATARRAFQRVLERPADQATEWELCRLLPHLRLPEGPGEEKPSYR